MPQQNQATTRKSNKEKAIRELTTERQFREATFSREHIDEEARTVPLAFSSEEPVERWFGLEILDHDSASIRLGRLENGGAVLVDHNHRDHVGVIESVSIDKDRRGRSVVRFGKSERATEIFNDVLDGIRTKVSFGYVVHKALLEETSDDESADVYRVTDWEPFEISIVSIPADDSVGVGRSLDTEKEIKPEIKEERTMPDKIKTPAKPDVDVDAVRSQGVEQGATNERDRADQILAIGDKYGMIGEARKFINSGGTVDAFREHVLDQFGGEPVQAEAPELGMSDREIQQFSFMRAINALSNPTDRRAQDNAAYEFEVSQAASEKLGRDSRGITVAVDILKRTLHGEQKRDLSVGTTTAGGHTVATDLLSGSFIELLRNRAIMMGISTVMTDLNGNIAIPRQTSGATGYWVAEAGAPTESQQAFDQVTLSPNTVGAFTDFSRKLMLQSSIDVEAFVRADLARVLGLAIDVAAINGSGASNQPTGILNTSGIGDVAIGTNGGAPAWSHIVELESDVAGANADIGLMRYITTAVMRGKLKQVEKASNTAQFVWAGSEMNGYGGEVTNQVPSTLVKGTSSDCHGIVFGNFADLLIGMWGGLDLTVDPYTASTSGTVRVVALQDMDISVRHPESFSAIQDARNI